MNSVEVNMDCNISFVINFIFPRIEQLGTLFVNGEWACSPFVTKSGPADNPAPFVPCVKSIAVDFISQNSQCSPGGIAL